MWIWCGRDMSWSLPGWDIYCECLSCFVPLLVIFFFFLVLSKGSTDFGLLHGMCRMLAVMTFNLGYFMSVLGGILVGELAVGRYAVQLEEH